MNHRNERPRASKAGPIDIHFTDDQAGMILRLPVRIVGAVLAGIARAATMAGAVLSGVRLHGDRDVIAAELRFAGPHDRLLTLVQRATLMSLALETIEDIAAPLEAAEQRRDA